MPPHNNYKQSILFQFQYLKVPILMPCIFSKPEATTEVSGETPKTTEAPETAETRPGKFPYFFISSDRALYAMMVYHIYPATFSDFENFANMTRFQYNPSNDSTEWVKIVV